MYRRRSLEEGVKIKKNDEIRTFWVRGRMRKYRVRHNFHYCDEGVSRILLFYRSRYLTPLGHRENAK